MSKDASTICNYQILHHGKLLVCTFPMNHTDNHNMTSPTANTCKEHDEPLPCKYCKTLEHFDNCPVYKKHNQCVCLLTNTISNVNLVCSNCQSPLEETIPFRKWIQFRCKFEKCDTQTWVLVEVLANG